MRNIKVGSRVRFTSRANSGSGVVATVEIKRTGEWFKVRTKDHPHGHVTVRRSQVS